MNTNKIQLDTGTDELLVSIEQRVGIIMLNKPDKKNALGDILTPALRQALLDLESDDRVGCIMITGAGNAFCSGGDVSGMGGGSTKKTMTAQERIEDLTQRQVTLTQRIYELKKVTIAALPGAAAGAGLSIALACDLRIAAENAFMLTAFKNIGLSGDYGGSWFLPRLIGEAKAKELYYTSERVDAAECARLGLVSKVFPSDTFRQQALTFAANIANGPTATLGRMKLNLQASQNLALGDSLALEAKHLIESAGTSESIEAVKAFMEKRKPEFHNETQKQTKK